jgi:MFS transporter, UMF1 family
MSIAHVGHDPTSSAREPGLTSPPVVGWAMYDLANTMFSMNIVSFFFGLWVVNVMGGTDSHYGYAASLSYAIVFLAAPFLGALTDQAPRRMPFLVVSTLVCVGFTLLLGTGGLLISLAFFVVANVAYQGGLQFYDALLPEVSTESNRGRVGGFGIGLGYLGSFIGLLLGGLLLGNVEGLAREEQSAAYARVFQLTGVLFLVFALPCFLLVRERGRPARRLSLGSFAAAGRQVLETARSGDQFPGLRRFLVGRVFYTDSVNTVIAFMGIYVTNEVGFTTGEARTVLLIAIAFAVAGGFAWGRVVDLLGPKRTLDVVLLLWMVVFAWAAIVGFLRLPPAVFWPVPVLAGLALGGTWAADRPLMLRLTPPSRIGEFYGLYGMVGRFSAITGPLVWALIVDTLGLGRPAAIASLLVGIVIGYWILRPLSDEPRAWEETDDGQPAHRKGRVGDAGGAASV